MKMINPESGQTGAEDSKTDPEDPQITIYEIVVKVSFDHQPVREVIDYLDLSAADVVLMFQQFRAGGFLPDDCRIILNTTLKKKFLSDPSRDCPPGSGA
jgi:hypothetical protein